MKIESGSTLQIEGINYVLPTELTKNISDCTVVVLPEGATVSGGNLEMTLATTSEPHGFVIEQETVQAVLGGSDEEKLEDTSQITRSTENTDT